jgi:two-component system sensor histidine kinase HydH
MDLSLMMHLIAGLGALGMGCGILIRGPRGARDRLFTLLCAALALWNIAYLGRYQSELWRPIYLFGSCAVAPLGLHFALALTASSRPRRRRYLTPAYSLAALLWVSSWAPVPDIHTYWNFVAIGVLGGILLAGVWVLVRHAFSRPAGAERRALVYVVCGSVIGVIGGMSDFVPRRWLAITQLGPLAVLLFLLVVCVVLVRFRFLDVDVILGRLVALIAGAAIVALAFFGLIRRVSDSFVALFLTSLIVLALAVHVGRIILSRSRMLLAPADPLGHALLEISRKLPQALTAEDVWTTIDEHRRTLPIRIRIDVYLRRSHQEHFHLFFRSSGFEGVDASPLHRNSVLPRMIEKERLPLTRRYLEEERLDAGNVAGRRIEKTLEEFDRLDFKLTAPFYLRDRMGGWIALVGNVPERSLTAQLAGDFMLVANQAAAALNRIETMEILRRKEALADVGELAAGLAHEVRNPVAAIRGAAQAMGPAATKDQRREMLEVIEEETERLGRVVGEFLGYAAPGLPHRKAVDLAVLIQRVGQSLELAGKRLEIQLHENGSIDSALGDPDQLHRVFENLITNAWEAAGDGGRLRVDLSNVKNHRIAARLEDNGPGISATEVPRLFKPFYTAKPGGTGLGLALVHRIVEAHQGEISVEGRPGIGAAFTVILQATDESKAEPT